MEHFVGIKHIKAEPQEKDGKAGYKVIYDDGYESWSPKETFEKAYFAIPNKDIISDYEKEDMPDFIKRMLLEESELEYRISNLAEFIVSEKFEELQSFQKQLLIIQINAMKTYGETLCARITNEKFLIKENKNEKLN